VTREEKLGLLAELPAALGPALHDLSVHDGDALPAPGGRHAA
jgi:hypothetical protein